MTGWWNRNCRSVPLRRRADAGSGIPKAYSPIWKLVVGNWGLGERPGSYHRHVIAFLPLLVTTGWIALLVAAPVLPASVGVVVYAIGSLICHQLPERSFHLAGSQLPVCARCLGIYVGLSSGAAFTWMRASDERSTSAYARSVRRFAALAAAPTAVTVALESIGAWQPANLTRAVAGLPLGFFIGLVVANALATLHYDGCAPRRPTVPRLPRRFT